MKHDVQFEGIFRLYPSLADCSAFGAASLVAIVSVVVPEKDTRRLVFVRAEDVKNQEAFKVSLEGSPSQDKRISETSPYAFLAEEGKKEIIASLSPLERLRREYALDMLVEAMRAVESGQRALAGFFFWGEEKALPRDYAMHARGVAKNLVGAVEESEVAAALSKNLAQADIQAYGLTHHALEAALEGLKAENKKKKAAEKILKKMKFPLPSDASSPSRPSGVASTFFGKLSRAAASFV